MHLDDINLLDYDLVKQIEWTGNSDEYDQALVKLANDGQTLVLNPGIREINFHHYIDHIPDDTNVCTVWIYKNTWVAKYFPLGWKVENGYTHIILDKPRYVWRKNSDLDRTMKFEDDFYGVFEPEPWDSNYQLVWYLDPKINPTEDQVWAISCQPLGRPIKGIKDMGYVMPAIEVERNPLAPAIPIDIDQCYPAYYDLDHECAWQLDPIHGPKDDPMWLVKFKPTYRKPRNWRWYGVITPQYEIEYNVDLPKLDYELDYVIPWHELEYEHVWTLDRRCITSNDPDIWAVKVRAVDSVKGIKYVGTVAPTIYDQLDVVFISYNEPNAEDNWARVLERAPHAKRVDGVKGIFAAHCRAAEIATTDMFYVVDGDAWLVDDWAFDYQPNIWNRHCAYVWCSRNPVNDLVYGYGGVKLFPRQKLLDAWLWQGLDMTTEVMKDISIMPRVSNETRFNTDEFSTWRSAFRECVKLFYHLEQHPDNFYLENRLDEWMMSGDDRPYGEYSIKGATDAVEFVKKNIVNLKILLKINDRKWLSREFKRRYPNV
jgi:hypothetical protein